jgi:8-oxo-dGTP pyrophosphatase MutT (NUDIX family)/phosphohistidine phosphatase SixA
MTRHANSGPHGRSGDVESMPVAVRAAGTVLWRRADDDRVEIAVVHRPHRSDWSLPKGKFERGETAPACAVRETEEETGYRSVLGRPLGDVNYVVPTPVPGRKQVSYFAAEAVKGSFEPNDEVDELRWLHPDQAADLLSYDTDRDVLARFTALPANTKTVLLVRHAKAGNRSSWSGPDESRPLGPAGREQAEALRVMLRLFGPNRVHAADRVRCVDTVAGLAHDLEVPVVKEPLLTEEAYRRNPAATLRRMTDIAAAEGVPVICSQGGVIPDVIARLAERSGLELDRIPCKKGSTWVLSFSPTGPLTLLAAFYLPTALPVPLP